MIPQMCAEPLALPSENGSDVLVMRRGVGRREVERVLGAPRPPKPPGLACLRGHCDPGMSPQQVR